MIVGWKSRLKWTPWLRRICSFAVVLAASLSRLPAQDAPKFQPASFLRANDSFAFDLLQKTHEQTPDRNIVVAPLAASLTFAALSDGTGDAASSEEFTAAFHWEKQSARVPAARMLLARFAKPKPYPKRHTPVPNGILRLLPSGKPEELWFSAAFLYRGEGSLSQDFMDRVTYDFGFPFRSVARNASESAVLRKNWDAALPMPEVAGDDDFWITSFTHLRTSWSGNTFLEAKREPSDFHLGSGAVAQAEFLKSEAWFYPYVRTDEFEAVALSCLEATILLVLPAEGRTVEQLEASLAKNPGLVDPLLVSRQGDVRLPPFHFSFETNLRASLEKMGVHRVFDSADTLLAMAPEREGGKLHGVAQKTEITVDENGIRADAGTIAHGAYGGILAAQGPFHMTLDRPFVFIIRDNVTGALLFVGAVMNPTTR